MKRHHHSNQALQLYPGPGMYAQHRFMQTCVSTTDQFNDNKKHGKMENLTNLNAEFPLILLDLVL